jgi:hypothetical protein
MLGVDVLKRDLNVLLAEVHVLGEGGVGLPLARRTGSSLLQHLVDLLEGEALGLRNKEVGEEEGDAAKTAPHEEDVGAELGRVGTVGDEVWGDDSNDAVPEPVRSLESISKWSWDSTLLKLTVDHARGWSGGRSRQ